MPSQAREAISSRKPAGHVVRPLLFQGLRPLHFQGFAMKKEIHPDYHEIKVVMTDGTEYLTRSTYGEAGATLTLDIDPKTHPAWTGGGQHIVDRGGRVSRFKSRYKGFLETQ